MAVDPDPHGSALIFPPASGSRRKKFEEKTEKIQENRKYSTVIVILYKKNK